MTRLRIAAVHRPGKARTGVTTYVEMLTAALQGHADVEFMSEPPADGFDLIHIIDIKAAKPDDLLNKQAPVIADLHDYYWAERRFFPGPDTPFRWIMQGKRKKYYEDIISCATAVIVHSRAVAKHVGRKKTYLVPIAIDFEKYYSEAGSQREPLIMLVGRDSWRKGLGTLITALKMISRESQELRIEVAGMEYTHIRLWAKFASLGVNLQFLGELAPEQLKEKYRQAMIVYLGSWQEGFGLSLAEGMAAGCVAVGSAAGGIPELVEDGSSGILFQPGDEWELSAKLRALLETSELQRKMAAAGQRRVKDMLSIEKMRDALLKAYEEVLKGAG
jgi:glycosyltransferase involved in cell wall biosynthesis